MNYEETKTDGAPGLESDHRFGLKLAELSRLWRQALDARLRPLGLSQARWAALIHLSAYPDGLTQGRLALRVGIRDSTLVPQLDALAGSVGAQLAFEIEAGARPLALASSTPAVVGK